MNEQILGGFPSVYGRFHPNLKTEMQQDDESETEDADMQKFLQVFLKNVVSKHVSVTYMNCIIFIT